MQKKTVRAPKYPRGSTKKKAVKVSAQKNKVQPPDNIYKAAQKNIVQIPEDDDEVISERSKNISNSLDDMMKDGCKILDVARTGSGKTYMMLEILYYLLDQKLIEVSRIIIFSKTVRSDVEQLKFVDYASKLYEKVRNKKDKNDTYVQQNTSETVVVPFLSRLFTTQKQAKDQKYKIYPYLIVFDDQISEDMIQQRNKSLIDLATIGRHYMIHSCWLLQSYRSVIHPTIRRQVNMVLLGHVTSDNDVEDILSEFNAGIPGTLKQRKEIAMQWYRRCIAKHDNHGFLRINVQVPFGQGRFQLSNDKFYFDV